MYLAAGDEQLHADERVSLRTAKGCPKRLMKPSTSGKGSKPCSPMCCLRQVLHASAGV